MDGYTLWHFDTPSVKTDLNVCDITIEKAIKKYRKINPTAFINNISKIRENIVI